MRFGDCFCYNAYTLLLHHDGCDMLYDLYLWYLNPWSHLRLLLWRDSWRYITLIRNWSIGSYWNIIKNFGWHSSLVLATTRHFKRTLNICRFKKDSKGHRKIYRCIDIQIKKFPEFSTSCWQFFGFSSVWINYSIVYCTDKLSVCVRCGYNIRCIPLFSDSPGPVSNIIVKDITANSAQVSWSPPDNDGGSPVHNYIVEKREADKKTWSTATTTCSKTAFRVLKLIDGKDYYFRVLAENNYGIGVPAETLKPVRAKDPISELFWSLISEYGIFIWLSWNKVLLRYLLYKILGIRYLR